MLREKLPDTINYFDHNTFSQDNAENQIMALSVPSIADCSWFFKLSSSVSKTNKEPVLTSQEESNTFLRYNFARKQMSQCLTNAKNGNEDALNTFNNWLNVASSCETVLVSHNLALVVSMVRQYKNCGLNFNDMLSEGNEALLRAVRGFDIGRGNKFSTYACWAIKLSLISMLRQMKKELSFDPDFEQAQNVTDERSIQDESFYLERLKDAIETNVAKLNEIELKVIELRYVGEHKLTYEEIGNKIGISRTWAKHHEDNALAKLRCVFKAI